MGCGASTEKGLAPKFKVVATDASTPTLDEISSAPFLVLYFDVNQTIVMSDAAQQRSVREVIDRVLASTSYGSVGDSGAWAWDGMQPSSGPPADGKMSYLQAVKSGKICGALENIGMQGGALEGVGATRRVLEEALELPDDDICKKYCGLFKPGSFLASQPYRCIVPAFFQLIIELTHRKRQFAIVIRTFGVDLNGGLVEELNAFAEGRHPFYPNIGVFDGQGGRQDLRISLEDSSSHGSFYEDADQVHLVLGTLERPPPDDGVSSVGIDYFKESGLPIVSGHAAISRHIAGAVRNRGILCYRDYWPWWGISNAEAAHAGKPMYIDTEDISMHPIFFDDHVGTEDAHIVNVRDVTGEPLPFAKVSGVHLFRSEPLDCLQDPLYFLKLVDIAESRRC